MYSGRHEDQPGPKELEERIRNYLLTALRTLTSLNLDISLYHFYHIQNIGRDPFGGNGLDEAYTMYEEQARNCQRWWMKLRAASEKQASGMGAANISPPPGSRPDPRRSPSPLEYQSALDEDELAGTRRDEVTPMDIDPVEVEQGLPLPPTSVIGPPPPKPKPKKGDVPTPRGVIVTPSGPTLCRLAPIPKGTKLSVEKTRIPVPNKPFTFNMPRQPITSDSERQPLNRTKNTHRDTHSSQNTPSSRSSFQSSNQLEGPSTAQTSVSVSPRINYSSAKEYWEPRRASRPGDFQMDKDRLFHSIDCLGPPFQVNMADVTHNNIPAVQSDLSTIYGGKMGMTPKISPEKLASHGFDHWMVPNMDFHPFLPARPGWPGLMLRPDDELEEWEPEEGTQFRVVIKREPRFFEYVGQYEMVRLGDITGDEWKKQTAKVKNRWTQVLGGGRSWNDTVARVALRKRDSKEPSIEDFKKFTDRLTPDDYATMARELKGDVDRAFCEGEEVLAVWGMMCVGYDFEFEKHLTRSFKAIKTSSSGLAKKRKAVTRDDGPSTEDEGEDEDKREASESEDSSPSKRQRTAKGKAKLVRFDWSDARFQDSEDEDYKPS